MLRDAQLLLERRQQCSIVGELALGAQNVGSSNAASREGDAHQVQVVIIDSDDVVHRLDLRQSRGDGHRLSHRVGSKCEVRRRELIALVLRQRTGLLHESTILSEQIRRVTERRTNTEHACDQAVVAVRSWRPAHGMVMLVITFSREIDLGIIGASPDYYLLGLRERSASACETGTVLDRKCYDLV